MGWDVFSSRLDRPYIGSSDVFRRPGYRAGEEKSDQASRTLKTIRYLIRALRVAVFGEAGTGKNPSAALREARSSMPPDALTPPCAPEPQCRGWDRPRRELSLLDPSRTGSIATRRTPIGMILSPRTGCSPTTCSVTSALPLQFAR